MDAQERIAKALTDAVDSIMRETLDYWMGSPYEQQLYFAGFQAGLRYAVQYPRQARIVERVMYPAGEFSRVLQSIDHTVGDMDHAIGLKAKPSKDVLHNAYERNRDVGKIHPVTPMFDEEGTLRWEVTKDWPFPSENVPDADSTKLEDLGYQPT